MNETYLKIENKEKVPGPEIDTTLPDVMRGAGHCCEDKMCEYHETKVGKSVVPGPEVYSAEDQKKILQMFELIEIKDNNLQELTALALEKVRDYWRENRSRLNGDLKQAHQNAYTEAKNNGRYLAGGWLAGPETYSQLLAVLWVQKKWVLTTNQKCSG
jgi:hypothetical protein